MALNQVGSALGYEELLSNAQRAIGEKVIGADKLAKANEIIGQITTTHLLLGQFGFYKTITNKVKELGAEYESTLKSNLSGIANLTDDMGTELKTIQTPVAPLTEGYDPEQGVFGKTIVDDAPEPQVDSEFTDVARIAPAQPPTADIFTSEPITPFGYRPPYDPNRLFEDVGGLPDIDFESRAPLFIAARPGEQAQMRRAIARGEEAPTPSEVPQVQRPQADAPVNRPVEGEIEDINNDRTSDLRVPAPDQPADITPINPFEGQLVRPSTELEVTADLATQARSNLAVPLEQGKSGFFSGFTDMYNKAQDLKTSVESGVERFNGLRNQATTAIQNIKAQGQATLEQGQAMLQQGKDTLMQAGQDALSQVQEQTSQITSDVVKAGSEAAGEVLGEAAGEGIAASIPVVGEVVDAGLLLAQLFTGIAADFKPHDAVTSIVSATSQYGV